MKRTNRWPWAAISLCACVGLASCMASAVHGDQITYTLAPWVGWCLVGGGALLAFAGLLVALRGKSSWAKAGGAALLVLAPALLWTSAWKATQEYVTVADDWVEYGVGSAG